MTGGGFSTVKTDHRRDMESGSKCHMRAGGIWLGQGAEGHRQRGITPFAKLDAICRGIKENSGCKGGWD